MPSSFVLALLWTLAIIVGCLLPGTSLPNSTLWSFDKAIHFGLFAGFAVLWMHALDRPLRTRVTWVTAAGVLFAVGTELLQGLAPGRSPEVLDAVADVGGLVVGVALCALWHAWQRRPVTHA